MSHAYSRQYTRRESVAAFWTKVHIGNLEECWPWKGAVQNNGYGFVRFEGKNQYAHRIAYLISEGAAPADMCVCHKCDNRLCVNPTHLWLGTASDNQRDSVKKGHHRSHGKLSKAAVLEIRRLTKEGFRSKDLAKIYNIHTGHVRKIIRGDIWKRIPL